jgi:hypothetical protein
MTRMESNCGNPRKIVSTALRQVASSNFEPAFTAYELNTYRFESGEQSKKRKSDEVNLRVSEISKIQLKVHPKARSTQKRRAKLLASTFRWVDLIRFDIFVIVSHETVVHNLNRHHNSAAVLLFGTSTFCFRAKSPGFLDEHRNMEIGAYGA